MQSLLTISTVLAIHILAWLVPGPLFFLIIRNSVVYSRRAGIYTAVGIACANFVHITYAVIGFKLLFSTAAPLMIWVQYIGAGYLGYLALKTLRLKVMAPNNNGRPLDTKHIGCLAAARMGFIANIFSPKAVLFFTSIFASLLAVNTPGWVIAVLWLAMPLNSFFMAGLLSLFFTQQKVRSFYSKHESEINKLLGVALLILAVFVACDR